MSDHVRTHCVPTFDFGLIKWVYYESCFNTFACSSESHLFKLGVSSVIKLPLSDVFTVTYYM